MQYWKRPIEEVPLVLLLALLAAHESRDVRTALRMARSLALRGHGVGYNIDPLNYLENYLGEGWEDDLKTIRDQAIEELTQRQEWGPAAPA